MNFNFNVVGIFLRFKTLLPHSSTPNCHWPHGWDFAGERARPGCRFPKRNGSTNRRSAPVPGRSNVAKPSGIGLANARCRLDIAAAGDGRAPPAAARPLPLISARQILTPKRSAAKPQPKKLHKEARKPGIILDDSWFPDFLIKKSSRNVTMLRDSTAKAQRRKGLCRRPPFPAPWRLGVLAFNSVASDDQMFKRRSSTRAPPRFSTAQTCNGFTPASAPQLTVPSPKIMKQPVYLLLLLAALSAGFIAPRAGAVLANAWHIPDNTNDLGFNMRNPEFEIGTNMTVTVYSGIQKYNNSYGTANQTGGTLYYKGAMQGTWNSTNLQFYLNGGPSTNNQYWRTAFSSSSIGTNEVIQYYLYLTFDGVNGVANTYLYGGDGGGTTTDTQSAAAASPFTIRNRAAWIYHGNNRVINAGTDPSHASVTFWVKIGYLGKDDSAASHWVNNARIYYTTDGSTPAGALGIGNGTAQAAPLVYDHPDTDPSIAGDTMWWSGTVSNLPTFTTINYKISAWHSSNNEEKFAEYDAGTPNNVFSFAMGTNGDPALTVNGVNADYTTTHVFVDEVAGDSIPLSILFSPNQPSLTAVEVFSNLNRRDRAAQDANGEGIEDGIVAPDGNLLVAGDDSNYYKAYTMTASGQPGQYALTLNAQKTGAYRLTARYKVSGNTNWVWYS